MNTFFHQNLTKPIIPIIGLVWIFCVTCIYAAQDQRDLFKEYQHDILPILEEYCYDCHMDGSEKGGLDLDQFQSLNSMIEDRKTWKHVKEYLSLQLMPPEDKNQPSEDEVEKILAWVNDAVFHVDPNNPDPGHVILRRLNAKEYENTVQDLLQVDSKLSNLLPPDDSGYGFDTVGGALSVSSSHIEKYLNAAETAISQLFQNYNYSAPYQTFDLKTVGGEGILSGNDYLLMSNGQVKPRLEHFYPGNYTMQVKAYSTSSAGKYAKMQIRQQGRPSKTFDVNATKESPQTYSIKVQLKASRKKKTPFSIHFINDHYEPKAGTDRNLFIQEITLIGPITDNAHKAKKVLPPRNVDESDEEYALRVLHPFVNRAFRRPVTIAEVKPLLKFLELANKRGDDFQQGLTLAMQAVLVSPNFLFREETGGYQHETFKQAEFIDEHALASRLSYFLWSTMPDEQLRSLADKGKLRENFGAQIKRMLKDDRSQQLVSNFTGQWLKLRDLELLTPNPQLYPEATIELRQLMRKETELYVSDVLKRGGNLLDFLKSDYTFLNDKLARHYDIRGIDGGHFRKVKLPDKRRGGLMTHASVLSISSTSNRTSPVLRGQFVLENILDTPAPPPPPNIPSLLDVHIDSDSLSLREQLAIHRKEPDCAGCHNLMDPIGLAFQNYDAIGRWRDKVQGHPVEPWGKLVSGESFQNSEELLQILYKNKRHEFLHSIITKLLTYGLGRGIQYYDKPALELISHKVKQNDYNAHTLIQAICESTPFQMKRIQP